MDMESSSTRSLMLDCDVLDCPVCFEPLTVPIFECDNGHLACSSCCPKLSNTCPVCEFPLGHKRCRAMESVVESAFVTCRNDKFGCTKKVSYGKESTHEKECIFSECSCPSQDCNHTGSYKNIFVHFAEIHLKDHMTSFRSTQLSRDDISFTIQMIIQDGMVILGDFAMRLCFVVQCYREPYGVCVTVSCLAPSAPELGKLSYHLSYTVDGHTMTYESPEVKRILEVSFQTPHDNFMLIPNSLLCGELLKMNLCIKKLNQE